MSEFVSNYRKPLTIAVSAVAAIVILIVVLALTVFKGLPTNGFYNTTTLENALSGQANNAVQPFGVSVTSDQCIRHDLSHYACTVLTDNPNVSERYSVTVTDNGTVWQASPLGPAN